MKVERNAIQSRLLSDINQANGVKNTLHML